ncbi:SDR family oxidoreductase [Dyadobacter sp. CY323]|uniref:SDR family oxidoreductase n=1 Tax=Dyadobacter sp. CY323 TaxID=2907302 RepID=UPI001F23ABDB|nr:NAD-dependent epimerase/dehydratase family protein [Dyadobacter sp. CY323]MCE6991822.1 NAD-dependent epimerase/dehydratase family protein [Dyadobacter sp. CY323]
MKIVITGSLGNIGKPLAEELIRKKHDLTIISSKSARREAIEALGAKAAIGTIQDPDFLTATFKEADIVYLMEAWEGIGNIFDKDADFVAPRKLRSFKPMEATRKSRGCLPWTLRQSLQKKWKNLLREGQFIIWQVTKFLPMKLQQC